MTEPQDNLDARLGRLSKQTEAIRARADFVDRVMSAIQNEPIWLNEVLRSSRRLVPIAVLAAVLSVAWGKLSADSANQALAATDEVMELEW